MSALLELFLAFAKIGLFTFGGGYAMIPLIEDTCVKKKRWITHDEMMNITVGILILDAAVRMMRKMRRGPLPVTILICAAAAMLLSNIFSVRISSIVLMLTAGFVSLLVFLAKRPGTKKGGAGK